MHLPTYLVLLRSAEQTLADSYQEVAAGYAEDDDVRFACSDFARRCTGHADRLVPIVDRYEDRRMAPPDRLPPAGLVAARGGPVGLLRDLQDLYQLANLVDITWVLVNQAAAGARDVELLGVAARCHPEISTQLDWLRMRMEADAAQTLLAAP